MRRLVTLIVTVGVIAGLSLLPVSGASFTSGSDSSIRVTTDVVSNWLHLYSQGTDPDQLDAYWLRAPTDNAAAFGLDDALSVDLGTYPVEDKTVCTCVFTIKTPPDLASDVTVSATLLPDPATGDQPIRNFGFAKMGKKNGYPNPIVLGAGEKRQVNLRVQPASAGVLYRPKVLITVTYSGMTATYYQYVVDFVVAGEL
jgi:hypothetical protein